MTTTTPSPTWQDALRRVRELSSQSRISDQEWQSLAAWLLETEFDGTSFLAGEAAALLISELAPEHVKENILEKTIEADGWPLYWRLLIQDESHSSRSDTIERCKASPIALLRLRGFSSNRPSLLVPRDWQAAIKRFEEWRSAVTLSTSQWNSLIEWLMSSSFGDKSYMAGELGAQLIRDLGSDEVLDQFLTLSSDDSWVIHFQNIAARGRQHPRRLSLLAQACLDSNWIVYSYAQSESRGFTFSQPWFKEMKQRMLPIAEQVRQTILHYETRLGADVEINLLSLGEDGWCDEWDRCRVVKAWLEYSGTTSLGPVSDELQTVMGKGLVTVRSKALSTQFSEAVASFGIQHILVMKMTISSQLESAHLPWESLILVQFLSETVRQQESFIREVVFELMVCLNALFAQVEHAGLGVDSAQLSDTES